MSMFRNLILVSGIYPANATVWELNIPEGGATCGFLQNYSAGGNGGTVDWGDGVVETVDAKSTYTHDYSVGGIYVVTVRSDSTYVTPGGYSGGYSEWSTYVTRVFHLSEHINRFEYIFAHCYNLTELPEEHKTPLIGTMRYSFFGCYLLEKLPKLNTSAITAMQGIAQVARSLKEVPDYDTKNVTNFYVAFDGCHELARMPNFDYSSATAVAHIFRACSKMIGYANPADFWENPKILNSTNQFKFNDYSFNGCKSLDNYNEIPATWGGGLFVFLNNTLDVTNHTASINIQYKSITSATFTSDNLPEGLILSSNGVLTGVFTPGTYSFNITANNGTSTVSEQFTLTVSEELDSRIPLTLTANKAGESVKLNTFGAEMTIPYMYYRKGTSGEWLPYTAGTPINLPNIGDSVQFWNNSSTLSTSTSNYAQFAFNYEGGISAKGNLMSLLNWSDSVPDWSFNNLFYNRTALTSLPLFQATQVGIGSYNALFGHCDHLVNQKVTLPSPTFYNYTYYNAFRNTSIVEADIDGSLGTKGANRGFGNCFVYCTSLKVIRVKFPTWYKGDDGTDLNFLDWVYGVPPGGTFYKPSSLPEEYGVSRIPEGWTVVDYDVDPQTTPLTFTAEEAGSTVALNVNGTLTLPGMHYRMGKSGAWQTYTAGTVLTLQNIGDSVQFWNSEETLSNSQSNYAKFATTGKIAASGNLQSMLNWIDSVPAYGFCRLFYGSKVTTYPELTATTLGVAAYYGTFQGSNFFTQKKLILPATNISNAGYIGAFQYNTNLEEVEILATTIDGGYNNCNGMFFGTSTLNKITVHFTEWKQDWLGNDTFWKSWVGGVAESGTFYKPSALPEEYGTNRIPEGWTVVNID